MVPDTIDDRRSKGPARKDYRIMYENGYKKLQDSLIDVIAEEQAKLGYMKEPIRLYYPLSSLHHFFESEGDAEAMQESLGGFPEATKKYSGKYRYRTKEIVSASSCRNMRQNMCTNTGTRMHLSLHWYSCLQNTERRWMR